MFSVACSPKVNITKPIQIEEGTITDNVYLNETINLRMELPSTMRYATDEELALIIESYEQYMDKSTKLKNQGLEFYATYLDNTANVNFVMLPADGLSAKSFTQIQVEAFNAQKSDKYKAEVLETTEIELADTMWSMLKVRSEVSTGVLLQTMITRVQDDTILTMTFTAINESEIESMLALVQPSK